MSVTDHAKYKNKLDALFRTYTQANGIHSAAGVVESLDGSFSWRQAYGQADASAKPMQVDTPFNIASVTKLLIAAAILRLAEDGRLDLDHHMMDYLPDELTSGLHRTKDGVIHTDKITIRHLLSHATGLPDYFEDAPNGEKRLADMMTTSDDEVWSIERITAYVREKLTAHFEPQDFNSKQVKVRYSDTNFQLLIAIIHSVTGLEHNEAFKAMFYEPLKMNHTYLPGSEPLQAGEDEAMIWAGDEPMNLPLLLRSLGDVNSTLDDLLAFMRALVSGAAFAKPETAKLMREDWHTFGLPTSMMPLSPNWPIQYGMGMMRFKMPRWLPPFQSIPAVIGHTGVSGSYLFYCPDLELILAGTFNQVAAAATPYRLIPRVLQLFK